ncbi:MAG: threonine--tRNA ligase [Patescibacteria group bacterium]|nr:threonine--tRNA ligase [Patescibacteria group bacterium]
MKDPLSLEHKRHTLAHLLAAAVKDLYEKDGALVRLAIGPAIDNGFYYDMDFGGNKKPTADDLKDIEKKMRKILPSWKEFSHREVSIDEAKSWAGENRYKHELIDEIISRGEKITFYKAGDFEDLCRGGHTTNPAADIAPDSFKLSRLAGAYWRGDEKNAMLTRIYGLAFDTADELKAYEAMLAEAEKRDHKKLGRELDLFAFSDLVGSGLPLWTPRGTLVRNLLDDYVWELRRAAGYEKVEIPHITKKELYETSGHWDKFKDELFRITTREGHEFAMKPMNCPHHTQIFARKKWSYRELPQRYANTTVCYRDEQSGELSGLSRVRAFAQDDAHVFCRSSQVKEEFLKVWDIIHSFYSTFGFSLKLRLSLHDPARPEKYLGGAEVWKSAEAALREIAVEKKADYYEGVGEAAFYGPKLDFMADDSLGRRWQVATVQLDMNMPERFGLSCTNEKGQEERIVMIHAAIMGSIERFMSILIEHTAGSFPLWLSPVQAVVIPVAEAHAEAAGKAHAALRAAGIRSDIDLSNDSFGKKIRNAKTSRVPYTIIIGEKDIAAGKATLESRDHGQIGQLPIDDILKRLKAEIEERKA